LDELAKHNKERWEALARANVPYSQPWLDLDTDSARRKVDPEGKMGDVAGKDVLCLAGGGGQQSAAFGLLGTNVTVLDFCQTQLERDREAAAHYGLQPRLVQGDMRDLSCFEEDTFDLVWHAHSLSFIPDPGVVIAGAARILRPGGMYRLSWHSAFSHVVEESTWTGKGYLIETPMIDGAEADDDEPYWDVDDGAGGVRRVPGPREFLHTHGGIINALVANGFVLLGFWEDPAGADPDAEPGTWAHRTHFIPPWVHIWTCLRPELLNRNASD